MASRAGQIKPLSGYPWEGTFSTKEELSAWYDQDKLTCLLCGREYVQLATHLVLGHGIPADDFKARFGIPWSYGLAGKPHRDRNALHSAKLQKAGKIPKPTRECFEKMRAARKRPFGAVVKNDTQRRFLAIHGRTKKWGPEDFEEYLRRIASGRTPAEVSRDEDMPSNGFFSRFLKENADFRQRYTDIWDSLPYSVHVRADKLGEKFQKDVVALRRQDLTWPEIAARLGVSKDAARCTWYILKKQGKLDAGDRDRAA